VGDIENEFLGAGSQLVGETATTGSLGSASDLEDTVLTDSFLTRHQSRTSEG